jgi:glycosyltransferase involved in cell wall biosynthesis
MRIAVIVPRYGQDVVGGAENQARGFAKEAVCRGWTVEVWTTCARSHYTWENVYPAGSEESDGVVIHRFPVTRWNPDRQAELEIHLASQGALPVADQYAWLRSGAHSVPLYEYIAKCAAKFDVLITLPYVMPLTHYAAWVAPERVVMWPCLHNEPYAYMEPVRLLLESVWGVMFNSPEEGELATRLLGMRPRHYAVLGEGVTLASPVHQPEGNLSRYLLYIGRLEEGKNLSTLYEYVCQYAEEGGDIRLVVLGSGPVKPPTHSAFDYRGFVSEREKANACASALALCQPSLNESFSLTIMESWLAGRPVLVHEDCAVTRGHVRRSKGGLWFRTYDEFVGAVEWLRTSPDMATRMGHNGREYVRRNYTWEAVVDRFECIVTAWQESAQGTSAEYLEA